MNTLSEEARILSGKNETLIRENEELVSEIDNLAVDNELLAEHVSQGHGGQGKGGDVRVGGWLLLRAATCVVVVVMVGVSGLVSMGVNCLVIWFTVH